MLLLLLQWLFRGEKSIKSIKTSPVFFFYHSPTLQLVPSAAATVTSPRHPPIYPSRLWMPNWITGRGIVLATGMSNRQPMYASELQVRPTRSQLQKKNVMMSPLALFFARTAQSADRIPQETHSGWAGHSALEF